jgi:excisionase family DNA binding protein
VGPDERWVGVDDVAAHLGVGKDSIYRQVESRGLPARKVGRLLARFKLSQVVPGSRHGGGEDHGGESPPVRSTNPPRGKQGQR